MTRHGRVGNAEMRDVAMCGAVGGDPVRRVAGSRRMGWLERTEDTPMRMIEIAECERATTPGGAPLGDWAPTAAARRSWRVELDSGEAWTLVARGGAWHATQSRLGAARVERGPLHARDRLRLLARIAAPALDVAVPVDAPTLIEAA